MRTSSLAALLVCALGSAAAGFPAQTAVASPVLVAGRATTAIRLDGALDEPAWRDAGVIPDLVQQSPVPGGPTAYHTEVRVLADGETLYLGIACADPEPSRIAVHTMQRDGAMDGDDAVEIVLDTFGERVFGYYFRVNAAGARQDGLIIDPENISLDWDGVWDARTQRGPEGWTVEIAIPSRTLRFRNGNRAWGFNVQRHVPREQLTLRWAGISLDARLADLRRDGELTGVEGLRQGAGLSIAPYGLAERSSDLGAGQAENRTDGGVDVTYNLGTELAGVVTVNTDFAETEADTRQINLTRFPLFYPEKRQFFTEGANQFGFGAGLSEQFIPFFSRRVGLFDGLQVPIRAGVKLIGREGRWGIGVLDVQTDDTATAPGTNLFAGRLTYDVNSHLRLGVIATRGNPDGVSSNSLVGADAVWQTSTFRGDKNLTLAAWAAGSGGDIPDGRRTGWGLRLDYPNDLWDVSLNFKEFGEALDPALGFLPRPGTRWYSAGMSYQPRPRQGWWASWVRQFYFELEPEIVTDLDGRTQSWSVWTAPLNAQATSGDQVEANWIPEFERLDAPFEISEGVVIPPGSYRFDRFRVGGVTSPHRPWQSSTEVWFGTFYAGTMVEWEQSVSYATPGGHLQLALAADQAFAYLPEGDFIERLWRLNAVWAFTPDLIASCYTQYDSESRNLGVNARLRWTVRPGTDLYLVWNHGWEHPASEAGWSALRPVSDQAVIKLRYTWRT